jgi:glycosyltransferase involved in cell wall biosynthesis
MQIHITNIYNISGAAAESQHMVVDIAKEIMHCNELGIYRYPVASDSPEMLRARLDGILAAVGWNDIVIFQAPSWNGVAFDEALMKRLDNYKGVKKIFFINDVTPLMFENNRYLMGRYIELYNQADLFIMPSQNMLDRLREEGLTVQKYTIQRMWDCLVSIDDSVKPQFDKVINFAGQTDGPKFSFVRQWKYDTVRLAVTAREDNWAHGLNIQFMGWFQNQNLLANAMRMNGGFGLLWSEDMYWMEYMKLNACSKLSLYLAAGIPVIVPDSIPEADTISRKNLGLVVESLDEAVEKVESMTKEQYDQMVQAVAGFGQLIRGGYFTKKVLTDAVFQLLYD